MDDLRRRSSQAAKASHLLAASLVCVASLLWLAFAALTPSRIDGCGSHQTRCANHLRQFGGILLSETLQSGDDPSAGGAPLFFRYRREHFIQRTREDIFVCPGDKDAHWPEDEEDSAVYDTVDLTDASALAPLCSYAVRDFARFPIDANDEREWIACDRQGLDGRTPHHVDGLNVLFDDGAVVFMTRERLGFDVDAPIVVGPDSPHPELRKMAFVPAPLSADDASDSRR